MNYDKAYEFIEKCAALGSKPGLDSIRELCRRLGNPQDELKFIHIAGTNGKGSTLAYISSILKSAGYKTGRYISPTISTYLERFDIDGKAMSKTAFAGYIDIVKPICEAMEAEGLAHPTAFEIETAIAFMYHRDKKCDIVVLECGMGGRLDATNLIKTPLMEVFAHIDMDHMQYLGDTIEKIAAEKSGIIKPGSIAVSGSQSDAVKQVIMHACEENAVPFKMAFKPENTKLSLKGTGFLGPASAGNEDKKKHRWNSPLIGMHQADNAALAITAAWALRDAYPDMFGRITDDKIQRGLDMTVWPGRMQILSRSPLTVVDGAHNPDAARRLKESVDRLFEDRHRILIMGMLKDKDIDTVADIMCKDADIVLTITPPENPRALRSVELAGVVSRYNDNVSSLDSVEEAVEIARLYASQYDKSVIIAFGSLSYMGRMISIHKPDKAPVRKR